MSDPKNLSRRATIPVRDPSRPLSSNKHLLKWIQKMVTRLRGKHAGAQVDRARGRALGKEAEVGWQPRYEDISWDGLDFPKEKFEELQRLDRTAWRREVYWA